eukprot:TRINITY_DN2475_c0_g1_i14.p1 TRINITY_DN2475_c0_g1~~TRINITY_DN2475_c0_g1_i14.p1  ORF type:complete len:320 (+),score=169.78 TRINITY_DN2475_c0_g1_i14:40-960(+)
MIRRPPRSTHCISSAASDVYKRQVYNVVGTTFNKLVLENTDDVIVTFYAPWCGHCKKLEPIFAQLAELLKNNTQLKFAKIDATKNDVVGHAIESFPTLKFFPGNNKSNVLSYEGNRTAVEIANFIKEKASYPIEIPEAVNNITAPKDPAEFEGEELDMEKGGNSVEESKKEEVKEKAEDKEKVENKEKVEDKEKGEVKEEKKNDKKDDKKDDKEEDKKSEEKDDSDSDSDDEDEKGDDKDEGKKQKKKEKKKEKKEKKREKKEEKKEKKEMKKDEKKKKKEEQEQEQSQKQGKEENKQQIEGRTDL